MRKSDCVNRLFVFDHFNLGFILVRLSVVSKITWEQASKTFQYSNQTWTGNCLSQTVSSPWFDLKRPTWNKNRTKILIWFLVCGWSCSTGSSCDLEASDSILLILESPKSGGLRLPKSPSKTSEAWVGGQCPTRVPRPPNLRIPIQNDGGLHGSCELLRPPIAQFPL